jgi:hypothetical protein
MRLQYRILSLALIALLSVPAATLFAGTLESTKLVPHVVPITDLVGMDLGCTGIHSFECEQGQRNFVTTAGLATSEQPYFYVYVTTTTESASRGSSSASTTMRPPTRV